LCVSLLAGSAIYLLLASGQGEKEHELYNLDRIMDLLLDKNGAAVSQPSYAALFHAVCKKKEGAVGGLKVDTAKLERWINELVTMLSPQSTKPLSRRILSIFVSFAV